MHVAGTKKTTKPALTFAQVRERIQRPRRSVPLVLDAEAAAQIDALAELLDRALIYDNGSGLPPTAPEVARRLRDAEDAAEASVAEFVVQALSHTAYRALQDEHPPSQKQIDDAGERNTRAVFNPDTLAPALVLAQLLQPAPPDAEEWAAFWSELSDGQLTQLWEKALDAQLSTIGLGARSQTAAEVLRELGLNLD